MATATAADDTRSEEIVATNLLPPPSHAFFTSLSRQWSWTDITWHRANEPESSIGISGSACAGARLSDTLGPLGFEISPSSLPERAWGLPVEPCPPQATWHDIGWGGLYDAVPCSVEARPAFLPFFLSFLNTTVHSSFPGKCQRLLKVSNRMNSCFFFAFLSCCRCPNVKIMDLHTDVRRL